MIPTIVIGFVLLDALLLWALVNTKGWWILKGPAIIVVLAFNFLVWNALGTYAGWPTSQTPPTRSVFVQGVVNQPDPQTGDPGEIYLWLIPLTDPGTPFGFKSKSAEPRAYQLSYSQSLYQQVLHAQQLQRRANGQPVVMQRTGKRGAHGHGHGISRQGAQMRSYILPFSPSPRKGPGQ